jgi:hypothetical protein
MDGDTRKERIRRRLCLARYTNVTGSISNGFVWRLEFGWRSCIKKEHPFMLSSWTVGLMHCNILVL